MVIKTSKAYKSSIQLTNFQVEALHGLMLGDLYAERAKESHNTRLSFDQGTVHQEYAYHLFSIFGSLINQLVYTATRLPDKRTGNVYVSLMFKTLRFPFFNMFRELYYSPAFGSGVKIIPSHYGDLFTAVSFAY